MVIKQVGRSMYACGMGNQVYRRSGDEWLRIDHAIRKQAIGKLEEIIDDARIKKESGAVDFLDMTKKMRDVTLLEDISGISENDIYTCGTNGAIWHWDGAGWRKINSGTRQHLHAIHCVSEDVVFMVGHNGTVLKGNKKTGFHRIYTGRVGMNFWSVKHFDGSLYIGTTNGIIKASGNNIGLFFPETNIIHHGFSVAAIDCFGDVLWVVTDKFVLRNSSGKWEVIRHPDNV